MYNYCSNCDVLCNVCFTAKRTASLYTIFAIACPILLKNLQHKADKCNTNSAQMQ